MLILSRKSSESIVIDGRIHVKIVRVEGDVVKVGILAPADVPVHRLEVYEEIQRCNKEALTHQSAPLPKLPIRKKTKATAVAAPGAPAAPAAPAAK
ncbi:MAG: carbon storage regulator CsrA [Verrucomicrobiota bacterium]